MEGSPGSEKTLERQIRAFHWLRLLAAVEDRTAGSPGEREAARRVEAWLREVGLEQVSARDAPTGPDPARSLALHLAAGALGCGLGGLAGAALAGLALASFRREGRLLARWLPRRTTRSLWGRAGARRPRRRVLLCARLDAPRARGGLATRLQRAVAFVHPAPFSAAKLALRGLQAAAFVALASALGASGPLLATLQLGLAAALALGVALALEQARARATPGANDASGVAALLTCLEQLLPQLSESDELRVVVAGGGRAGAAGLADAVEQHPEWRDERTVLLHFDRVGGGALHYLRSESTLARSEYSPRLRELARRLAEGGAYREITPVDLVGETDARAAAARGLHALALIALEPDGAPRGERSPDDPPESLDLEAVVRAADFAAAVVVAGWRGESDPLAIV
jgi:hypothetical protein